MAALIKVYSFLDPRRSSLTCPMLGETVIQTESRLRAQSQPGWHGDMNPEAMIHYIPGMSLMVEQGPAFTAIIPYREHVMELKKRVY